MSGLSLTATLGACGGGATNPVQAVMDRLEQAEVSGDGFAGCALLDAHAQASVALLDRLFRLGRGEDSPGSCPHGWPHTFDGSADQRQRFLRANQVTSISITGDSAYANSSVGTTHLLRERGDWNLDSGAGVPNPDDPNVASLFAVPADCLQSWNDSSNPQLGELQGGSSVVELASATMEQAAFLSGTPGPARSFTRSISAPRPVLGVRPVPRCQTAAHPLAVAGAPTPTSRRTGH